MDAAGPMRPRSWYGAVVNLIEDALTAATLRAKLAATGPAGWRARAITTYAEIANLSSQDEEAAEVLAL